MVEDQLWLPWKSRQIEKLWTRESGVLITAEHQYNKPHPLPPFPSSSLLERAQFIIQPFFAVNELLVETPHVAAV